MSRAAQTYLVPVQEMTPGMVAEVRNSVIDQVVRIAAKELGMAEKDLVVRDVLPVNDLGFDFSAASGGTGECNWEFAATVTTVGYATVTGASTMSNNRYVAIFGVRDLRMGIGATYGCTDQLGFILPPSPTSLIKFEVGGAVKAIWDTTGLSAYREMAGFTTAPILIPQNAAYNIYFYNRPYGTVGTGIAIYSYLQLIGVTVEPRGQLVSP